MKKGDKVKVKNNSGAVKIVNGKLDMKIQILPGGALFQESPIYKIIDMDLKLPSNVSHHKKRYNDTIIQNVETDEIYFTCENHLKKVDEKIKFEDLENGDAFKYEECGYGFFIKNNYKFALTIKSNNLDFLEVCQFSNDAKVIPIKIKKLKEMIK